MSTVRMWQSALTWASSTSRSWPTVPERSATSPTPSIWTAPSSCFGCHSRRVSRRQEPRRQDRSEALEAVGESQRVSATRSTTEWRTYATDALHKLTTRRTRRVRHGRGRRPQCHRNAPQPTTGPPRRRCRIRGDPTPAHLQGPTQRLPHHRGRPLVPLLKDLLECGAVKAKLPLHVRVFACDTCGLVLDRDENAAHNLVALAAACITGTGVAGDQDTPRVSKPRGADRKTRRQRPDRNTGRGGRAGGASLPHQRRKEAGDRRQDTEAQLALW